MRYRDETGQGWAEVIDLLTARCAGARWNRSYFEPL